MQNPHLPPPLPPPLPSPNIPELPSNLAVLPDDLTNLSSTSVFDWSELLDFSLEDTLSGPSYDNINDGHNNITIPNTQNSDHSNLLPGTEFDPGEPKPQAEAADSGPTGQKVRKRDPRLVCSNFLAGRIPCACPEMDRLEEEERNVLPPGKRRARMARSNSTSSGAGVGAAVVRCQVPECEADISELKGYHKRHRVCLMCANAAFVVLEGESRRYCQQCGKFHVLSDFDEGKRSCRRKLERHNNRRRRKSTDSKGTSEKEDEVILLAEDVSYDDATGKDAICLSSQLVERDIPIESEGQPVQRDIPTESEGQPSTVGSVHGSQIMESERQLSTLGSTPGSHIIQSDSFVSYTASGEAPADLEKENLKYNHSPSYYDNKSAFSSVCPTGRVSFKLYDWNPADFPRRLRHQIFQWLASMPVELEGYIRPGCTIFTVFIAMPKFMWVKLAEEPAPCIHNFIVSPGNLLNGRGTLLVYLNNMIFHILKDGTSVIKDEAKETAPKLHYVHPVCFEAGKPMEFVACGSNLLQPKFRFLLSFSGKYLACDYCVSSFCHETEDGRKRVDHQVVKIYVPETAPDLFGPAFIEVENESGLSNFIPVLIGSKEICADMRLMQQKLDASFSSKREEFAATDSSCEMSVLHQLRLSEFILDVAWSLKEPTIEDLEVVASSQIQRFNHLSKFLIENDSTTILDRVLYYMKVLVDKNVVGGVSDADMRLFQSNIDIGRGMLSQRKMENGSSLMLSGKPTPASSSIRSTCAAAVPTTSQCPGVREQCKVEARMDLSLLDETTTVPLLQREIAVRGKVEAWRGRPSSRYPTGSLLRNRSVIFIVAAAAVCLGVCAVILHPQNVQVIATTIRCLFEDY